MRDAPNLASDADIEETYRLSPMQRDMLFHSLSSPGAGTYLQHAICDLRERLQPSLLAEAWRRVVLRHPILRTSFRVEAGGDPSQEVHRQVRVRWLDLDWCALEEAERDRQFEAYIEADRRQDFVLDRSPPMRITLFRFGAEHFRFALSHHHALLDGRSVRIVLRELFDHYDALSSGLDLKSPPAHPFREYVDWLERQDAAAAEAFWRTTLDGAAAPTRLLEKRAGSAAEDSAGYATAELRISRLRSDALRSFARDHELSLNTLLLAAWARVLARYSGESDVSFDTTVALRGPSTDGLRDVVGVCINTVPLRVQVESGAPMLPWLQGLRAQWLAMRPHAWLPAASIHRHGGARGRMLSSLVVYEHATLDTSLRAERNGWDTREFEQRSGTSHPLTVVGFGEPQLLLKIVYARSRFDEATIGPMLDHLRVALEGTIDDPHRCVGALPMLTEAETRKVLVEWNDTARDFTLKGPVHELFAQQAARTPDAVAVDATDGELTYRALDERSNQLAHHLQRCGIVPAALAGSPRESLRSSPPGGQAPWGGPAALIGVSLNRTPELIVALLGILKAGAAYLPLDPSHPMQRLERILRHAKVSALIATEAVASRLPAIGAPVIVPERDRHKFAAESIENPRADVGQEHPAYVVYTSGSTGQPKGILVPHRALTNHTLALIERYGISESDRRLQFVSITSDVLIADVFPALICGATIVLRPDSDVPSVTEFLGLLEDRRITITGIPSAYWHEWVSAMAADAAMPFPASLRIVISGMDSPRPDLFAIWRRAARERVRWFNAYGPSETTCTATIYEADLASDADVDTIPIGRPIANVRVYLLDADSNPVPVGVPGEICIGGAGVARGYLGRPDLTAERFVPDPFSGNPDDRLYRTGDLGRHLPDGNVVFLGRADNQIKIRGYRVEPGEVNAALLRLPGVCEAVVVARSVESDARKLVAYVVVAGEERPLPEGLRAQLFGTLPDYMVPAAVVLLDVLPRTPNGKIDFAALPEAAVPPLGAHARPTDVLEQTLAAIWQQLLGVAHVSIRDNFFELGGDSLLAVRMIGAATRACGASVPIHQFLTEPTIEEFAARLRTAADGGAADDGAGAPSTMLRLGRVPG